MRVVIEYDSGEIWGQYEIYGDAAERLLPFLSETPNDSGEAFDPVTSVINDLRSWCLAEISRRDKELGNPHTPTHEPHA